MMAETPQQKAEAMGVDQIRRHIFLCCDQTKPKCSDKEVSLEAWNYLKKRLKELNLSLHRHQSQFLLSA